MLSVFFFLFIGDRRCVALCLSLPSTANSRARVAVARCGDTERSASTPDPHTNKQEETTKNTQIRTRRVGAPFPTLSTKQQQQQLILPFVSPLFFVPFPDAIW
jgi:hypothetical protein